jgi:hypothetical protein
MKDYSAKLALLSLALISLLIAACTKPEATTNREATSPTNSAASTASPAATTSTTASSTGATGVPECDAFLNAYEACVKDKVPALARPTFDSTLAQWKKTWHDQAQVPAQRAALVAGCKNAQEQAKSAMKAYGCSFE